jgi:DNA-binding CsgD family transcriptional regulator
VAGVGGGYGPDQEERFIDRLYEAAAVPELWRGALIDLARIADAKDAVLIATRGPEFNRWVVSSPEFEDLVLAHSKRFPTNERTRRLLAARHPGFMRDTDVLTLEEMRREPVYHDFLIPRGYGWGVATAIFVPSGDAFVFHAECAQDHGPVRREIVSRLDRLRPHFARAALLSARLEMERAKAAATALELIGLPAAVLGRRGRTLAANASLVEMMPNVIQDLPSRIALVDRAADALLAEALKRFSADAHARGVDSIPVRAREGHPPIIFHLVPVCGAAHDVFSEAMAILVATPVVPGQVPTADVVQGLFDLTPSEAKLATLIAAGHAPAHASTKLGVTEETARTTLKRVLAKTGLRRQADLVGLLRGAAIEEPEAR